jgi:hypothetical protein
MNKQWDRSFFKVIQHILMSEWDPIGIKDFLNTEDEYDPYAMRVYSQLAAGADADQIAKYLTETEYGTMGLGLGTQRRPASDRLPVAKHLIAEWEKFKARSPA